MSFFHSLLTSGGSLNLDTYFDALNLQSNNPANFTLVSDAVSQWNDLSGQGRHAKQATAGNRPLYNNGEILFDGGSDVLNLDAQFQLSTFSFYAVVKSSLVDARGIMGGSTTNYIGKNTTRALALDNSGNGGGNLRYQLYGDEYYQVISYRRTGSTIVVKVNGRELIKISGTAASANHNFRFIGTGAFGSTSIPWNGIIRSISISTSYLSDADDTRVLNALFTRYALPETSNAIVGFGDSITYGTGASNAFTTAWLPTLCALLSRPIKNFGIAGSRLTALDANSGIARYNTQVIERPYSDTLCILYGTNDITGGVNAATYEQALITVLNGFIDAGYTKSKIIMGTVPYRLGDALASTVQAYNVVITNACSSLGLPAPADVYNTMKAVGDSCMADTVHPNDTGHLIIRDAFAARI